MLVECSLSSALVEKYTFWQSEDDSIIGYEKSKQLPEDDEEGEQTSERESDDVACTRLKITLPKGSDFDKSEFCNSAAEALIQRIPVLGMDQEEERFDPNRPVLTLLNVLCTTPSSLLKRVGMLLSRLDNLSKILVWNTSKVQSAHLLELCSAETRSGLSFTLLNCKAFVAAVISLATLAKDKSLTGKLGKEKPPVAENFDFGADYIIIENPKKVMVSAKSFGAAYSRPEEVSVASPKLAWLSPNFSHTMFPLTGKHFQWGSQGA